MQKYKTYLTGEITLHVAQIVNTEQLQHCRNMVCFMCIIVNTLHKGDNKDYYDDNNNNIHDSTWKY